MNVFAYIRVSGRGQLDGDGPDRQRESIQRACSVKGMNLLGEKFERAVSGTVEATDRPAFVELLTEIECRRINGAEVEGIIVERMDRLARDLMVSEFLLAECRKRGIKVFSSDQELVDQASNDVDPTRILIRQVMGALAQWEKSQIVMKLAKARQKIRDTGQKCEGAKQFGEVDKGESAILNFLAGVEGTGLSWASKAKLLNEAGFTTRIGSKWTRNNIRHIVKRHVRGRTK